MLDAIVRNLKNFPPVAAMPRNDAEREAAVLLALTAEAQPQIVLTRRAAHLNDHAGEVAFPGGMWDRTDESLLHTALRESHEEVSLAPDVVDLIATMPVRSTRMGVRVTPFVGVIPPHVALEPELSELDAVFRVPLSFLLDTGNLGRDIFPLAGEEYSLPCYHFADYRIWGFTLAVLADFLNQSLNAGIHLTYPPMKQPVALDQK